MIRCDNMDCFHSEERHDADRGCMAITGSIYPHDSDGYEGTNEYQLDLCRCKEFLRIDWESH